MYTEGIRKITDFGTSAGSLVDAKHMADSINCKCFTFNGIIFIKGVCGRDKQTMSWYQSPFKIEDFKVKG